MPFTMKMKARLGAYMGQIRRPSTDSVDSSISALQVRVASTKFPVELEGQVKKTETTALPFCVAAEGMRSAVPDFSSVVERFAGRRFHHNVLAVLTF